MRFESCDELISPSSTTIVWASSRTLVCFARLLPHLAVYRFFLEGSYARVVKRTRSCLGDGTTFMDEVGQSSLASSSAHGILTAFDVSAHGPFMDSRAAKNKRVAAK